MTALHHLPQSASVRRRIRAGETTTVMKAGTSTRAASRSLPAWLMSTSCKSVYESSRATSAGVARPVVSTGLRISILIAQRTNEPCVLGLANWLGSGSLEGSPSQGPVDSSKWPSPTLTILSAHLAIPAS